MVASQHASDLDDGAGAEKRLDEKAPSLLGVEEGLHVERLPRDPGKRVNNKPGREIAGPDSLVGAPGRRLVLRQEVQDDVDQKPNFCETVNGEFSVLDIEVCVIQGKD